MPLVSIIVPVYNTEKYLGKCLDSLLTQTLKDIEILLIDDGSTDSSGMICDSYAHNDKRIQVLHIPNQGASHARNKGLEIAEGEYILFVDSDDWIETDMINALCQLILKYQADLSTCGYFIEDEDGHFIYQVEEQVTYRLEKWDAIRSLFQDQHYRYKGNLWDKLYRKKIIDKNQLRFNEEIYYNEDRLFIFQYFSCCHSIAYTTLPFYHYVMRNSSAMNTFQRTYNEKMVTFMDAFEIMTLSSETYPLSIRRILSLDYIKSAISFFKRNIPFIPFRFLQKKLAYIIRRNYSLLSMTEKTKYTLSYIKILILYVLSILSKLFHFNKKSINR